MIEGDTRRCLELAIGSSTRAKRRDVVSLEVKQLDSVVSVVTNDDGVIWIDGQREGSDCLVWSRTSRPKRLDMITLLIKDLDPAGVVADDGAILLVKGDAVRNVELAICNTLCTKRLEVLSLIIKDLYSVVVLLTNKKSVLLVESEPERLIKLAVSCAL